MAINTTFLELIDMLREEVGRSTNVGVGVDDLPSLKRHINRAYALLRAQYDWPHLRHLPTRIPINAGQRLYDLPATLELDALDKVIVFWGTLPMPLERGISFEEYAVFDSDNDVRSDPPQRWDLRFDGNHTQIEIWPLPSATGNSLMLEGSYIAPDLVDDADKCRLDDNLVVLAAAARILKRQGSKDADTAIEEFNAHLKNLRKRVGPSASVTMGGVGDRIPKRTTVTIAAR
jgi:hypothetical protein